MSVLSPDTETFCTPPTTPAPSITNIRPSLSRRSSRPSSIHVNQDPWTDIVVEETSPQVPRKHDEPPPSPTHEQSNTPRVVGVPIPPQEPARLIHDARKPMDSPCFVHSHLDKGASLTEWLHSKQNVIAGASDVGVARSLQNLNVMEAPSPLRSGLPPSPESIVATSDEDYETDYSSSLTKQLAETAVSVRDMSKQLGRARVRTNIQTVLIVTKARDNRLIKLTRELALYLMLRPRRGQRRGLVVYVDHQLRHSRRFDAEGIRRDYPDLFVPTPRRRTSSTTSVSSLASANSTKDDAYSEDSGQLRYWTPNMCTESPHLFDFVVTLGGDGTVLFTSWLFQRIVPPVLSFALGSLGFLTNFDFADHQAVMDSAIDNGIRVNLRMRFTCTVYRAVSHTTNKRKAVKKAETGEILMKNIEKGGWEALEGGWSGGIATEGGGKISGKDKEIKCFTTRPAESFEVLNDLVVDRGPSPYVSLLELFGDEHHMTTVQADGLTVSTPTGSTAYSLSAGGSLVHPEIPSLLITPICPHTLSFRPMLLPDSMELRICVPYNSRSTAWASFDGRGRVELKQGDHIKVTASKYPYPTVCAEKQSTDWFHAISRTLKWNERERQKSFVVVEEEAPTKPKNRTRRSSTVSDHPKRPNPGAKGRDGDENLDEEDEISDGEEEEDTFDIDDSSAEAAPTGPANSLTAREEAIGREKAYETLINSALRKAALVPPVDHERRPSPKSPSGSGYHSGVETPSRFAGPEPHIPARHVGFAQSELLRTDHNHSEKADPRFLGGRTRVQRNAIMDGGDTPTASALSHPAPTHSHHRLRNYSRDRRSRSVEPHHGRRAFAVWGNDETDDSNASDSSVDS